MAYGDIIDLPTVKVLRIKCFVLNPLISLKTYIWWILTWICFNVLQHFLLERVLIKTQETGINSENKRLAEELLKPIIKKFEKQKVHSSFIDNIWGAALANM